MRLRSLRPAAARALAVGAIAAGIAAVPASANAGSLLPLAGWWPMYEGSGQVVHDLSGNGNNGMLGTTPGVDANDPTWIKGVFGAGLHFDGNDVVRIPDSPSLNTTKVTAAAWVRNASSPGAFKYVLSKGATAQCRAATYGLYTASDGGLRFYDATTDGTANVLHLSGYVQPAQIWDGRWHFVAGTWDGTTAKLFVDGRLVPGGSTDQPFGGTPSISGDMGLGDYNDDCDLYYTGDIDEVAVFNQALPVDRYWSLLSALLSKPTR